MDVRKVLSQTVPAPVLTGEWHTAKQKGAKIDPPSLLYKWSQNSNNNLDRHSRTGLSIGQLASFDF